MLPQLSGPSRPPASGGKPKQLVILLHGLGADGNDLIGLAPYWAPLLPEAEFISPNAPFPCDMGPYGYQWFSAQDRSPAAVLAGVRAAAPILDAFISDALGRSRARGQRDGAGRLFARHDDVAVRRVAARRAGSWYPRIFGTAARSRVADEASCVRDRASCWFTAPRTRLFPTPRWRLRNPPLRKRASRSKP